MTWSALGAPRLRVAISGHRLNQIPEESRPGLNQAVGRAMEAISTAAKTAGHGYARLTVLSALAEGADRYAAQAALARGWRLEAPLPFSPARYEQDFEDPASKAEFRALLARARKRVVLDGDRLEREAGASAAGYAALGLHLAAHANLLISVWNGKPPAGPGGTSEVAARALDAGAPVIWITPDGAQTRLILPQTRLPKRGTFRARLHAALTERFPSVAQPVEMRVSE